MSSIHYRYPALLELKLSTFEGLKKKWVSSCSLNEMETLQDGREGSDDDREVHQGNFNEKTFSNKNLPSLALDKGKKKDEMKVK